MNEKQMGKSKKSYILYIILGALYVIIKIIFVLLGYLHKGAILHGLIPMAFTVGGGFMALKQDEKASTTIWNKVIAVLPVLIFIITPVYMYLKQKGQWLTNGRKEVLIIYEIMAAFQFVIALKRLKNTHK